MNFRTRRVLFITPFYMLFEFFLLKYLFLLFGEVNDIDIMVITVLIGINHFVPMLVEIKRSYAVTRFLTVLDGIWMWASVMLFFYVLALYSAGYFVSVSPEIKVLLLAAVPILGCYNYYTARSIVIRQRVIELENLNRDITIAHLSDVHFGSLQHGKIISDLAARLKELEGKCSLAVISGDLADGSSAVFEDDFLALKDVNMPIVFTPGNHDFYPGIENVIGACRNANVIVLDNEAVEIEGLNIFGLRFSYDDRQTPEIDRSVIKSGSVNILNYHPPYHWEHFSSLGFDIQLSGHTHGGQFYPVVWICSMLYKYNMGLFTRSGKYLHVTSGVGSMDTPMRWGTKSEIVILKLLKK